MVVPITVATPYDGRVTIVNEVTVLTILKLIRLLDESKFIFWLVFATNGGWFGADGGVGTVIETVPGVEVPPGPVAV